MSIGELISNYNGIVVALATVAIAFFTYTLWRATSGLFGVAQEQFRDMKTSLAAAQKAADAAEKSANALPAMERAYIFVTVRRKDPKKRLTVDWNNFCEIVIKNQGKTPAVIRYIESFATVLSDITPEIEIKLTGIMPRIEKVIQSGEEYVINVDTSTIKEDKLSDITNKPNTRLLCYGLVQYEDVFGESHDTGWCWWFEPITTKDFHFLDHPNNYRT